MGKRKSLTKKQLAVIEDLFAGELDEQAVLNKHRVSRILYDKWLSDECFTRQFTERIGRAYRQSELIIARYAPLAAAKLVQLTESESHETARKACLDIISMISQQYLAPQSGPRSAGILAGSNVAGAATAKQTTPSTAQLPSETASRLLAALAEETDDGKTG